MKKRILVLLVALLMSLPVFGCFKNLVPTPPDVNWNGHDVALPADTAASLRILVPSGNQNETTMIQSAVDSFNLKYPKISIGIDYVALSSYESTIVNQHNSGVLADILWTNSPEFYYLVDKKLGLPLDRFFELSTERSIFSYPDDFYSAYFDMGASGSKHYAVPRSTDSVVTFYNKAVLTAAGVDMASVVNGWTWEAFYAAALKIRAYFDANQAVYKNCYVLEPQLGGWLSVVYPILRSFGADLADMQGNVTINSEGTRAALGLIKQLVADRIIPGAGDTVQSSFDNGTAAFLWQSQSVSTYANKKELKGKLDLVTFPLIGPDKTQSKVGSGIAGYSIYAGSAHKNEAWAFLSHLMSVDGQEALAAGGLNLPSIRKDLQDYATAGWSKDYATLNLAAYTWGEEYKTGVDVFERFDAKYKYDLDQAMRDLFLRAVDRDRSIDTCINYALDDIDYALSR
jgi:multiple sugar transport system substrate-binding protein